MKTLFLALSLFLSVAFAGDRSSAYKAICKPMQFETDRANCMSIVKRYSYFDDRGLQICVKLNFDDNKLSCMQIIGDKVYESYEMDSCISQTFDTQKVQCLQDNGTPYNPSRPACVPREEAIKELSNSLYDLRNGNLRNADARINALLTRFTNCN